MRSCSCIMRRDSNAWPAMTNQFRIAIMDALPRKYWADDEGITDGEKFHDLLSAQNGNVVLEIFYASENEFPKHIDDYDGYLITGSPASANDPDDWISKLSRLVVEADSQKKRIVASCFGHQLVAKTFGGEVSKNEHGWLIGNFRLQITREYDWMQPLTVTTDLYHFNQERVTRLPEEAVSFARCEDYPDFAYTIGDNILCVQGHPEQPLRAMNNFLAAMDEMSEDELRLAREKIDDGIPDADTWGQWMMRFFLR